MKPTAERRTEPEKATETPAVIELPDLRQRTKKVTSGSATRQRKDGVFVRLFPEQRARLATEAASSGVSIPAYLVAGRLGDDAVPPPMRRRRVTVDTAALLQALVAFNRAGNNLNQTARALNELLLIAQEQSNARLEKLVEELAEAIRGVPGMFMEPVAAILAAVNHDREG